MSGLLHRLAESAIDRPGRIDPATTPRDGIQPRPAPPFAPPEPADMAGPTRRFALSETAGASEGTGAGRDRIGRAADPPTLRPRAPLGRPDRAAAAATTAASAPVARPGPALGAIPGNPDRAASGPAATNPLAPRTAEPLAGDADPARHSHLRDGAEQPSDPHGVHADRRPPTPASDDPATRPPPRRPADEHDPPGSAEVAPLVPLVTPRARRHGADHAQPPWDMVAARTGRRPDAPPTEVHVHIGRVEVNAIREEAPAPTGRQSRRPPEPVTLDAHLARRRGGQR